MNEAFENELNVRLKHKYEQMLKKDFKDFYSGLSLELNRMDNIHNRELVIKNLNRAIKTTKTRWINKILSDKNNIISKEIEVAEHQYRKVLSNEISIDKFKSFFGVNDINEYKKKLLNSLDKWKNDSSCLLTDFTYLNAMSTSSITTAFKNDILTIYSKYENNMEDDSAITKIPSILGYIPIDTTGRADLLTIEQKKNVEKTNSFIKGSTIDRYIMIDEEEQNKLLIQLEQSTYLQIKSGVNPMIVNDLLTQIALIKAVKYLNRIDVKVIRYYYTHFHKMVLGEPIIKSINTIVKDLGLTDGIKNYEAVENSIAKLGSIHLSYNMEGNSINGVFLESKIYELNEAKIAEVYLGNILKELIIKKSTLEYDESLFNSLSDDAQQLAIWLQKRRYAAEINKKGYYEDIYLKQFSTAIYWNTKNHYRQRDRIKAALTQLKDNNMIIEEFNYDNKMFIFKIEYIPLSEKEKAKLDLGQYKNEGVIENVAHALVK